MNLNILIGGEAGQGLKTISSILGKSLFRMGYNLFSTKNYMSRIRGGHNFMKIRIGDEPIDGPTDKIDILIALNEETIELHQGKLVEDGVVIFDGDVKADINNINLPTKKLAKEINKKGENTIFIGALLKVLGLELDAAKEVISTYFDSDDIREDNLKLLETGYEQVESIFELPEVEVPDDQLYLNGNQAIGLGAAVAGVKFYSAYPMTPSTGIMNYLAQRQDQLGLVVEQAEDEIGAINMAIGASYGGIRAMTGTSGGGFSLMTEGLGLAGVSETPLVVAEVQRPGPATGLPTRTAQSDLLSVINASQGEFPLMVISPRDQKDAFYQTFRAFDLAEKYQIPVVILSDQFLADSAKNVEEFNLKSLKIERHLVDASRVNRYHRYQDSKNGVSPRAYPGQIIGETIMADSHEHDFTGAITEDIRLRNKMMDKRARKMEALSEEDLRQPEYIGQEDIDYLLVGFGSTYGPLKETQSLLAEKGLKVGLLSYSDIWPLPTDKLENLMESEPELVIVENNSTGQLARLISSETGYRGEHQILKYDGRPFTADEIYHKFEEEVV